MKSSAPHPSTYWVIVGWAYESVFGVAHLLAVASCFGVGHGLFGLILAAPLSVLVSCFSRITRPSFGNMNWKVGEEICSVKAVMDSGLHLLGRNIVRCVEGIRSQNRNRCQNSTLLVLVGGEHLVILHIFHCKFLARFHSLSFTRGATSSSFRGAQFFHSMTPSCLFNRDTTFSQAVTDKVLFATFPKMRTFLF